MEIEGGGREGMVCLCSSELCDLQEVCTGLKDLKASRLILSLAWEKTYGPAQGLESIQKAWDGEEQKQDIGRVLVSDLG